MTAAARYVDVERDLLELLRDVRDTITCPVCTRVHCLTDSGRIWTHGPRRARCRGSQLRPSAAQWAARTVRGVNTIHLPEES